MIAIVYFRLVDGGFGEWGDWEECPVSCGAGVKSRTRACNNPVPSNGGDDCSGERKQTQPCNVMACPGRNHFIVNEIYRIVGNLCSNHIFSSSFLCKVARLSTLWDFLRDFIHSRLHSSA